MSSGFGGGKTYAVVMKAFQLSALNRNIPGGIVCPSWADFTKDFLPLVEEILDINKIKFRHHKTEQWFRFPWSKGKCWIVSAEKRIRGPNWGWCVINESTLIAHLRYKEAIGRVRIKNAPYPQIASSGTPEGTINYVSDKFIENPMRNSRIIFGDTRDNIKNLNEDYIPSLEDSYDSIMLDAYLKGLFINMTGNRFYYAYDPAKNDNDKLVPNPLSEIHVSMDFNVNPMTANLWNIVPIRGQRGDFLYDADGMPMKKALGFDGIELPDSDTYKMAAALKARGATPDKTIIYPDPSGGARSTKGISDIQILQKCGFKEIRRRSKAPDFRRRQLAHNNLLDKGWVQIHPKKCKGLKRDYQAVEQDPATYQKIKKKTELGKKLTHHSDGADYMLDILFPLSGTKPDSQGSIKIR